MDSALHYKVHKDGINKEAILKHIEYPKSCYLYYSAKDHI